MFASLKHERNQMLMVRPWEAAECETYWSITGAYPGGEGKPKHTFTDCVAMTLPCEATGSDRPVFVFVGALALINEPIDPAWITHAIPLLLVHRDEPDQAYYQDDQVWIDDHARSSS
ncbi:hypothetical protein [Amycolatopsis minnesotensis]|uniref:Uncharacterized protein n=1 Tax=Amycolatopsis minnesotensis TaxID=337894 RepID=A0ABN2SB12_9PSEU